MKLIICRAWSRFFLYIYLAGGKFFFQRISLKENRLLAKQGKKKKSNTLEFILVKHVNQNTKNTDQ